MRRKQGPVAGGGLKSARFGALLRHHRLVSGFSQEYLAEQAGVSVNAIGAWESGTRRAPYRENVASLLRALPLSQEEQQQLQAAANGARARTKTKTNDTSLRAESSAELRRLPLARTSFFGRSDDVNNIQRLFASERHRIVTITGPGGVGKTRLAIEAARGLEDTFPDGARMIELAGVTTVEGLQYAFFKPFGIMERKDESLLSAIHRRLLGQHVLLVIDNCEHLLGGVGDLLSALLSEHSGLSVLATSREAMRLSVERVYVLDPLIYPKGLIPIAQANRYPALEMFVNRASRASSDGFVLSQENFSAVTSIVRRLDGLPLAIELAIPMLRILTVQELAVNLTDRFGLLVSGYRDAPDRHKTLNNVISWSYDSLSADEQVVFESCSILANSFDTEAVTAICRREDLGSVNILTTFLKLVEKSLIVAIGSQPGRFTMLDMIREYAQTKARTHGLYDQLMPRVAKHFLKLANQNFDLKNVVPDLERHYRIFPESQNIELVLTWALSEANDPRLGTDLMFMMKEMMYHFSGSPSRHWFARAVQLLNQDTDALLFARAVLGLEGLSEHADDVYDRIPYVEKAIEIFRGLKIKEPFNLLQMLVYYGYALISIGEFSKAQHAGDEAVLLARECGRHTVTAWALRSNALLLLDREPERQRSMLLEALDLLKAIGTDPTGYAFTLGRLAEAELFAGATETASECARDAVRAMRDAGGATGPDWAVLLLCAAWCSLSVQDASSAQTFGQQALQACADAGESVLTTFALQSIAYAKALLGDNVAAACIAGYCEKSLPTIPRAQFRLYVHVGRAFAALLFKEVGSDEFQRHSRVGATWTQIGAIEFALKV